MPRKSRRRSRKRKSKRSKKNNYKRKRRITKKIRKKRRRRKKRVQKGGNWVNKCNNPFQGKYVPYEPLGDMRRGVLTRQLAPQRPLKGGGSLWRNLGFTFPVDLYHDSKDFLSNVKHAYMGDRQDTTSDVMKQPLSKLSLKPVAPTNYTKAFIEADKQVASKMQKMSS
tara:strand:+ start:1297 stop:1800 length:504 start_codon:yes stop_codon:yes gene_type:complete